MELPLDGKVAFSTYIEENEQLNENQTICFINPEFSEYFAEAIIPQSNFGKVEIGQKALLRFPSYPFKEYGFKLGKISFISKIPFEIGYKARLTLPNGLTTSNGNAIQFREGLIAEVKISLADLNLLQRFYHQFLEVPPSEVKLM